MNTRATSFHIRHRNGWATGCGPRPTVCAECGDALPPPAAGTGSMGYGCDSHSMTLDARSYEALAREPAPALKRGESLEVSRVYCFECCGRRDEDSMRVTGRAVLYLTYEPRGMLPNTGWHHFEVSNWSGSLRIPARGRASRGAGGFGADRIDVWFEHDGARWYGIQRGNNSLVRCKRLKDRRTGYVGEDCCRPPGRGFLKQLEHRHNRHAHAGALRAEFTSIPNGGADSAESHD